MKSPFTHNGAQTSYSWGFPCESNLHRFLSHQTPINKGIQWVQCVKATFINFPFILLFPMQRLGRLNLHSLTSREPNTEHHYQQQKQISEYSSDNKTPDTPFHRPRVYQIGNTQIIGNEQCRNISKGNQQDALSHQ